jgi:ketosteroid isomerase-like protein
MSKKNNLEIVQGLMEAWERGDMEAVFALYDPAIVWDNSTLPAPNAGVYHGHEGVRQFFQEWLEAFEDQHLQAETFIDAGGGVVVGHRISGRGKSSGAEVEMFRWQVYRVRNGLVTRIDVFETRAEALEAADRRE